MTLGAGLCSKSDPDYCPSYVTLLDNAILRIPNCLGDGSFVWPDGNVLILKMRWFQYDEDLEIHVLMKFNIKFEKIS